MVNPAVKKDVSWLGARLREPSTYAGLAALAGIIGLHVDQGVVHDLSLVGTGLGGLLAFFLPES